MKENPTKDKVIDAASFLFFQNGFHGTSVRDIAEKAAVNVSLISYYFKSKQGLLEYAVTHYYDQYVQLLEDTIQNRKHASDFDTFTLVIYKILAFKIDHYQLTAFIQRELSLDSTFVREMTVTYLAKENYLLSSLFFKILSKENRKQKEFLFIQLKGMLLSPFILKHELTKYMLDETSRQHFIKTYAKT